MCGESEAKQLLARSFGLEKAVKNVEKSYDAESVSVCLMCYGICHERQNRCENLL